MYGDMNLDEFQLPRLLDYIATLTWATTGAMVGARGCISYAAGTEMENPPGTPISGTGVYTVAVAWQGTNDTFAPTVGCGNGLYGSETRRRVVRGATGCQPDRQQSRQGSRHLRASHNGSSRRPAPSRPRGP